MPGGAEASWPDSPAQGDGGALGGLVLGASPKWARLCDVLDGDTQPSVWLSQEEGGGAESRIQQSPEVFGQTLLPLQRDCAGGDTFQKRSISWIHFDEKLRCNPRVGMEAAQHRTGPLRQNPAHTGQVEEERVGWEGSGMCAPR